MNFSLDRFFVSTKCRISSNNITAFMTSLESTEMQKFQNISLATHKCRYTQSHIYIMESASTKTHDCICMRIIVRSKEFFERTNQTTIFYIRLLLTLLHHKLKMARDEYILHSSYATCYSFFMQSQHSIFGLSVNIEIESADFVKCHIVCLDSCPNIPQKQYADIVLFSLAKFNIYKISTQLYKAK